MRKTLCLSVLLLIPFVISCAGLGLGPRAGKDPSKFRGTFHASEFDVPVVLNEQTAAWIDFFQGRGRKHFAKHLERSYRYIPEMQKILKKYNLPKDLVYIALIESGFNAKARSRANAVGFWQFISGTGRRYNLKINRHVDERSDFEKSTDAAARYLRDLYQMFGDWYLAAAGYNAGEGKVQKAIRKMGSKDFWKLAESKYLMSETKNYIPKFMAAMIIAKHPEHFGFTDLNPQEPLKYETVQIKGNPIDLRVVAKLIERDRAELETLNPELRVPTTPLDQKKYALRVPREEASRFRSRLASLPRHMWMAKKEHKVREGETLDSVAKSHNVSVRYLAMTNGLSAKGSLKPGQRIGIPYDPPKYRDLSTGKTIRYHRVRPGDSLWKIAREYNIPLSELRAWNKGKIKRHLRPGQKIALRGMIRKEGRKSTVVAKNKPRSGETIVYSVKDGDSLWTIANAHGVTVGELKAWNSGKIKKYLKRGQKITIKGQKSTTAKKTTQLAMADKKSSKESSSKSAGKTYHTVKAGDTLSTVAVKYGVRIRDLKQWNKGKLGKYLKIGQRLQIEDVKGALSKTITVAKAEKKAPTKEELSKPSGAKSTYKVRSGDSLWSIANRNNVSVANLKKWNEGKIGRHLKPGQRIKIIRTSSSRSRKTKTTVAQVDSKNVKPSITPAIAGVEEKETIFHTISSGDTLWDIARKYGVKTSDIRQWNGIERVKYLRPGDKLKIYVKQTQPKEA